MTIITDHPILVGRVNVYGSHPSRIVHAICERTPSESVCGLTLRDDAITWRAESAEAVTCKRCREADVRAHTEVT